MKRFILAALAATLVSAPTLAAAAPRHGDDRVVVKTVRAQPHRTAVTKKIVKQRQVQQRQVQQHRWAKGQRFDARYARNYRVVQQPRNHRLYDAPRGYRWVQSGHDAVLVGITSGIIGAVLAGVLN